jgi:hypothetical protein
MRILVLNWGVAKEYSWQHTLFEEMAFIGCQFTVISARKAWAPRGGKEYPQEENYEGIRYLRLYKDIPDFKAKLKDDIGNVLNIVGESFDAVWAFHQANWHIAVEFARKINCKLILTCEQAFRTSGFAAGAITDRWREIQETTDLIISWAPQDKTNEEAIGVKYLPFGGCFRDIEKKTLPYGFKRAVPFGIYQGSINPDFKNQDAMFDDISWFLDRNIVDKFVVNGYPISDSSKEIIKALSKRWGKRFYHSMLIGRDNVMNALKGALFGYSPMKPAILSNFPYEAFGIGVLMYMPYIQNAADYIMTDPEQLREALTDSKIYDSLVAKAKAYYDATHSVEIMGQTYYETIGAIL